MYKLHPDDVLLSRGANPRTGRISPFEQPTNSTSTSATHCPCCHHHPPTNPDDDDKDSSAAASPSYLASLPPCNRSDPQQPRRPPSASTCPAQDLLSHDFQLTCLSDNTVPMPSDDTSTSSDSFIDYSQQPITHHDFAFELSRFLPPIKELVHPSEFRLSKPLRCRQRTFRRVFRKLRFCRTDSRAVGEGVWLRVALGR